MGIIAQCPSCRALVGVDRVVLDGDRAGLRCSACLAVGWLPVERALAPAGPPVVSALPPASIIDLPLPPLPTTPVPDAASSTAMVAAPVVVPVPARRGFDDEVVERIGARLVAPGSDAPRQHELAARFTRLLSQWDNEQEHKQLLKAAAASDELAFVGGRYRAVLDVVRDEPRARAAQQELITLAMATMSTNRSIATASDEASSNTLKIVAAVVVVVVAAIGFGVAIKKTAASLNASTAVE